MKKESKPEPQVGIFWWVKGKLVFDATTLQEAEPYGDHLTHPRSHIDVWRTYRRTGDSSSRVPIRRISTREGDVSPGFR